MVPPVFVYWLAAGIELFGDTPLAWKLWTFPFHLLLAASLFALLRRFAPGVELPLLWMLVLSPAVLPSVSLMIDLPVLALGLATVALMLRADAGGRVGPALLAGLCAGLALQTKYNGVVYLLAALAYAALAGRWRFALLTGGLASAIFLGWEGFVAQRYGESSFLTALLHPTPGQDPTKPLVLWGLALFSILGATAPGLGLLALRAIGAAHWLFVTAVLVVSALFLGVLPRLPPDAFAVARSSVPVLDPARLRPELLVFLPLGLAVVAAMAWALRALLRADTRSERRLDLFLAAWLALEVIGFFVVSPFPAVRRVLGLSVVMLLLCGRLLSRQGAETGLRLARPAVAWSIALGLLFCVADLSDALTRRRAVDSLATRLRELGHEPGSDTVWFTGHWGFQFYAQRLGMRPVMPGRSRLEPGDWLVVPDGTDRQPLHGEPGQVREIDAVVASSPSPWTALPSFYHGPVPLRAQARAQLVMRVYRVADAFVPARPRRR